jgi:hypothetical protein
MRCGPGVPSLLGHVPLPLSFHGLATYSAKWILGWRPSALAQPEVSDEPCDTQAVGNTHRPDGSVTIERILNGRSVSRVLSWREVCDFLQANRERIDLLLLIGATGANSNYEVRPTL